MLSGKEAKRSVARVDSKSVKDAFSAEEKGYDGGKEISGINIPLGVATLGFPRSIQVTSADESARGHVRCGERM